MSETRQGCWAGEENLGSTQYTHWGYTLVVEAVDTEEDWSWLSIESSDRTKHGWSFYAGPPAECEWALLQLAKLREGDELPYKWFPADE